MDTFLTKQDLKEGKKPEKDDILHIGDANKALTSRRCPYCYRLLFVTELIKGQCKRCGEVLPGVSFTGILAQGE